MYGLVVMLTIPRSTTMSLINKMSATEYTQYPIIRNGDQAPPVGFLKNSPI
jgi:hypothetical protein